MHEQLETCEQKVVLKAVSIYVNVALTGTSGSLCRGCSCHSYKGKSECLHLVFPAYSCLTVPSSCMSFLSLLSQSNVRAALPSLTQVVEEPAGRASRTII